MLEVVTIPIRTVSEANFHQHWRKRQRRAKEHRSAAHLCMRATFGKALPLPLVITLTRVAPSRGLDSDNLPVSMKHVRDGIADWLGIDDRDPRVTWLYDQRRGGSREYGVQVVVNVREDLP